MQPITSLRRVYDPASDSSLRDPKHNNRNLTLATTLLISSEHPCPIRIRVGVSFAPAPPACTTYWEAVRSFRELLRDPCPAPRCLSPSEDPLANHPLGRILDARCEYYLKFLRRESRKRREVYVYSPLDVHGERVTLDALKDLKARRKLHLLCVSTTKSLLTRWARSFEWDTLIRARRIHALLPAPALR